MHSGSLSGCVAIIGFAAAVVNKSHVHGAIGSVRRTYNLTINLETEQRKMGVEQAGEKCAVILVVCLYGGGRGAEVLMEIVVLGGM